jgi:hypothetical protein
VSAEISTPESGSWLRTLLSGRPHQVIHSARGIYMYRWYLLPRSRWCNVYLHKFVGSDDAPALHNHPWWFASLVVSGSYVEVTEDGGQWRGPGSLAYRPARHRHRLQLTRDASGRERPCVSIVITGPHRQTWGFFCPHRNGAWRFIHWRDFSAGGCGEVGDEASTPAPVSHDIPTT